MQEDIKNGIQAIVKKIVRDNTGQDIEVNESFSLINSGLIDSLSMVILIQALAKQFNIDIDLSELTSANFDSIEVITKFIMNKK